MSIVSDRGDTAHMESNMSVGGTSNPALARLIQAASDGQPLVPRAELMQAQIKADQLRAGTYDNTAVCVYDGTPAVAARLGETGNRYGVCAACQNSFGTSIETEATPARSGYDKPTAEEVDGTHARAPWCTDSHEDDEAFLSDVCCFRYYDGSTPVPLFWPGKDAGVEQTPLLSPVMDVRPYSDTEARRVPVVNVAVVEDHVVEDMGPDELSEFIAKVRAQCDVLDQVHTDLVQARAQWNEVQA